MATKWVDLDGLGVFKGLQDSYNDKKYARKEDIPSIEDLDISSLATKEELSTGLSSKQDTISDLNAIRTGAALGASAIQEHQDISGKVDKVNGKQLSTEDFTTALKNKLTALSNYDDSSLVSAVNKIRTDFDTLVSGDTSTTIESFNDVVAFLSGIEDSENLDHIISVIEQQIAGKLDKNEAASTYLPKMGGGLITGDLTATGTISATKFVGEFEGTIGSATNADSAEKDSNGNIISSTYATKNELTSGLGSKSDTGHTHSYNDLTNKPTIPSAVTESTVSSWGFTKNAGTVTGIKINGSSKTPSNGIIDLGSIITSQIDISGKLDKTEAATTYATKTDLSNGLSGKSDTGHTHDDRYYTESEINTKLAAKSDTTHTHSYNDLTNKPTIPAAVTESTVSGWGFTKNAGTVTGVKVNGTTKNPSDGVVDLGTVITAHQDISGKVDKVSGKGLSTNDYTTTEKNKLAGIETGAQVNTITGVKGNSESSYRTGNVNITAANIGLGNVNNTPDSEKSVKSATTATKATQDGSGNVITSTYATKAEVNAKTDTRNTTGSTNSTAKLFLVGAETQTSETQTSSNSGVYMTNGTLTASAVSTSNVTTNVLTASSGTINGNLNVTGSLMINGENFAESAKGEETVTIKCTLNGSSSASAINGAKIEVYDTTTGKMTSYNWSQGNDIIVIIAAGNSYVVKPYTINSYMPPIQFSATAVKNYARTVTLNYTTPPTGVYYCTDTGFLKTSASGAVAIYVANSTYKRLIAWQGKYSKYDPVWDDNGVPYWCYCGMFHIPALGFSSQTSSTNGRSNMGVMISSEYVRSSDYTMFEEVKLMPYWVSNTYLCGKSCYIPAYQEYKMLTDNKSAIVSAFANLGVTVEFTDLVASSYSSDNSLGKSYVQYYNGSSWSMVGSGDEPIFNLEVEISSYSDDYWEVQGMSCNCFPMVEY